MAARGHCMQGKCKISAYDERMPLQVRNHTIRKQRQVLPANKTQKARNNLVDHKQVYKKTNKYNTAEGGKRHTKE